MFCLLGKYFSQLISKNILYCHFHQTSRIAVFSEKVLSCPCPSAEKTTWLLFEFLIICFSNYINISNIHYILQTRIIFIHFLQTLILNTTPKGKRSVYIQELLDSHSIHMRVSVMCAVCMTWNKACYINI